MILYIDTSEKEEIIIAFLNKTAKSFLVTAFKRIKSWRQQSEKLIPTIELLLKKEKIKVESIKEVLVNNYGGSFTSLRIGVISANALAFALSVPVRAAVIDSNEIKVGREIKIKKLKGTKRFAGKYLVEPIYDREPNIGKKKPVDNF